MKKPTYNGKELLPLSVIDAARDGDSQAVDQVLRYYEGYINKLCMKDLTVCLIWKDLRLQEVTRSFIRQKLRSLIICR